MEAIELKRLRLADAPSVLNIHFGGDDIPNCSVCALKERNHPSISAPIRQRHVDNDKDPEVSITSELFALACGPTWTPISINSCVVDGVRYAVHSRNERRITQNSNICSPGPDREMYYSQLQEILEFKYLLFKVVLFRVKWFDTRNKGLKQVFYLEDKAKPYWRVVEHVNHKKFSDEGVIVVEDDPDIIHFDNSSDLLLSTSLNDLDNANLHIDGQSKKVDIPPDIIIDVVDEDDDITNDEDALPHDLPEFDNEDLINVDDDATICHHRESSSKTWLLSEIAATISTVLGPVAAILVAGICFCSSAYEVCKKC
nr:S-adenosyl-L-methionine-dependent methyltransferases superfamily protein [Tanacetum cinerariifolium]